MKELDLIQNKIKSIKKELIKIREDIHSHPELSNEEFRTMDIVSKYLTFHNIKHVLLLLLGQISMHFL